MVQKHPPPEYDIFAKSGMVTKYEQSFVLFTLLRYQSQEDTGDVLVVCILSSQL